MMGTSVSPNFSTVPSSPHIEDRDDRQPPSHNEPSDLEPYDAGAHLSSCLITSGGPLPAQNLFVGNTYRIPSTPSSRK